jgi:hypothetical protein
MSFVPIEGVIYPERTEGKMDIRGPGCILSTREGTVRGDSGQW